MEEKQAFRKNWIDAAKGIAILIVVLNHSGLHIPGVNFWGGIFYVPIFFLLSGYTYHPTEESLGSFAKKKTHRLLLPYFVTNLILFLIFSVKDMAFDADMTDSFSQNMVFYILLFHLTLYRAEFGALYGRSYLFKSGYHGMIDVEESLMNHLNSPTWFLPALFLVLVCADGIYRKTKGKPKKICLILGIWLLLMIPHYYLGLILFPWSSDILPILLIFFFIGYYLNKEKLLEKLEDSAGAKKWGTIAGCLIIAVLSALLNGSYNLSINDMGRSVVLCIVSAMSLSCLVLLMLRWLEKKLPAVVKTLGRLGRHTLTILCWHFFVMQMFFTAVSAVLGSEWRNQGAQNALVCLAGIVGSVAACVCLDLIIEKLRKFIGERKRV